MSISESSNATVTILIPSALRGFTRGENRVTVQADHVGAALALLTHQYPDIKPHLLRDTGEIQGFVNLFVNATNIRDAQQLATPLRPHDEILIVPALAGG